MPADHKERAFEIAIETHLVMKAGYTHGDNREYDATGSDITKSPLGYDRELALFPGVFISFVKETQRATYDALEKLHGTAVDAILIDDLRKALDGQAGSLGVLRHGFKCFGKTIHAAYFAPAHGMNPDTLASYKANLLTVTRQVHYSTKNENSVDLLLALNGVPVATAELKNQMSGQNAAHAKYQYTNHRDPREKLFLFKARTLVHFAVDPDLVYMTTKLDGNKTHFLPFNRGNGTGAGNPDNPSGYKTAYLWQEVWQRDSMLDILARFIHLQVDERTVAGKKVRKETMVFPRYHQLTCVGKCEAHAKEKGVGNNYLIQHSAGSGKSNSIAWLAHRLASLHDVQDKRIFDSVVVITDRRVLDKQLQDTIYQFEHKQGVVQKIDEHTGQLIEALEAGTPIVITTLQKFPFILDVLERREEKEAARQGRPAEHVELKLSGKNFAVIIDEAHSSQSGEAATELKGVLASENIRKQAKEEAEAKGLSDYEEEILKTLAKRKKQPNISFFAFTATPKYKTLEFFGEAGADGKPQPFHLYSMRQAIEEGFIHDVLKSYTTYTAYYRLLKRAEDDPEVAKGKAVKALARFMSLHPHNVAQKTEVMLEHFRTHTRHKIGGRAKAMVVTGSRLHAVRYKQEFDRQIAEKGYKDVKTLVAFSGTVEDPDIEGVTYTEPDMNRDANGRPIREKELPERFDTDEYQLLLVAEKYQTGFDQPLLHTMYVDKRLDGVQAVQTLSRLNRTAVGKEDTFVLDFVNRAEEVQEAFKPYYEQTLVGERSEYAQLYELQGKLNAAQVYRPEEVEVFCKVFFKPRANQTPADHAAMNAALDPAVSRFKALADEDKREEFRGLLTAFRNLYSFLSQVIPFGDSDLEKLYTFARFLMTKLPRRNAGPQYDFDDDVTLKYYRLQKISEGSISLSTGNGGVVTGPTAVGTGKNEDPTVELSRLIDIINEKFGTDFKPADELFFSQIREEAVANTELVQAANANTKEHFRFVFQKALEGLFIDRMDHNEELFVKYMNDSAFRKVVDDHLLTQVYDQIRDQPAAPG